MSSAIYVSLYDCVAFAYSTFNVILLHAAIFSSNAFFCFKFPLQLSVKMVSSKCQ